jgi:Putative enzyme of poly-gamma-glutamate biosynthesis (capsule formation)
MTSDADTPVHHQGISVTLTALGDLMLSGTWDLQEDISEPLRELAKAIAGDIVFVNLESSLEASEGHIEKQPRILTRPATIQAALKALGVSVVTLANNHVFDGNPAGCRALRELIEESGVGHFGAGDTLDAAAQPYIMEVSGLRLGFLGFVSATTELSHIATVTTPGVNALLDARDEERARRDVQALRNTVDHVLVSLHWGVEYCALPSPDQIAFARSLIDSGASVVIGHHPHVVQGTERYGTGLIAYSLGNATTTDHYIDGRRAIRQTERTCSSCALRVTMDASSVVAFELIPLRCVGATVKANDAKAMRYIEAANRSLARGISPARWRRVRIYEDVVLRTLRKLHPSVLRSLRPQHFTKFFRNIVRAVRGRPPAP